MSNIHMDASHLLQRNLTWPGYFKVLGNTSLGMYVKVFYEEAVEVLHFTNYLFLQQSVKRYK